MLDAPAEEREDGPPQGQGKGVALMIECCNQGLVLERIRGDRQQSGERARELFIKSAIAAQRHKPDRECER